MAQESQTNRKRQVWVTAMAIAIVAVIIYVLSLTFGVKPQAAVCTPTPTPIAGPQGIAGLSAYDLWIAEGNAGTKSEFLESLVGEKGPRGYQGTNGITSFASDGASAYQLWLDAGNKGTVDEFLESLIGSNGSDGSDGSGGVDGIDGLSAFELWLSNGNAGELSDFLASLEGADGASGQDGKDGKDGASAYDIWLASGNTGTQEDFIASLKGLPGTCSVGDTGKSAYEIWLAQGNSGTQQDFLDSLKGEPGTGLPYNGSFFDTTTQLNSGSTNVMRYNTTDPWTVGIHINSAIKSRITFEHPGVYNIQFSTQFAKTDSGTDFIDIWLRKNGNDVPMTNTELRSWGNDDRQVAAWNFFVEARAGDYYEIAWRSADANIKMLSTADNSIPGIPSVILTVTQVR